MNKPKSTGRFWKCAGDLQGMKFFFHQSFFIRSFVQIEFTFFCNTEYSWYNKYWFSPIAQIFQCAGCTYHSFSFCFFFSLIVSHSPTAKRTEVSVLNFFLFISLYSFFCFVFLFCFLIFLLPQGQVKSLKQNEWTLSSWKIAYLCYNLWFGIAASL